MLFAKLPTIIRNLYQVTLVDQIVDKDKEIRIKHRITKAPLLQADNTYQFFDPVIHIDVWTKVGRKWVKK